MRHSAEISKTAIQNFKNPPDNFCPVKLSKIEPKKSCGSDGYEDISR